MLRELVREILLSYGDVIEFPKARSFDFIYEDSIHRLLIKTLKDLESLRRELAEDLKRYAKTFECSPLIVALKRRNVSLLDRVVYIRHDLPAVSPLTLKESLEGKLPKIIEYRGGLRMFLSKSVLENIPRSILSEILDVSRKSVYEYTRGMGISASKYDKIVERLGEEAIEDIDLFSWEYKPQRGEPKNEIDKKIALLAREEVFRFSRRPGRSALMNSFFKVLFTIRKREAKTLHKASDRIRAHVILIGKDDEVPYIEPDKIEKIKKDEILEIIS